MALIDQKKKVFGNLAAMRTLTSGFPKLKTNSSFPSINNGGDSLLFLVDLLTSLVGYEKLKEVVIDTLVFNLKEIETEVKIALKEELKSIVNCGVNPSIPTFLRYGNAGIVTKVTKIDYFNSLLVDPSSQAGDLLYDDVPSGINSTDFNTFLYNTIQLDGNIQNWGSITHGTNILSVRFDSNNSPNPNNSLYITASQPYSTSKTLTDLNNDYIDSLTLFGSAKLINNIIDSIFGSISFNTKKSAKQLEKEGQIKSIIDKMIKADESNTHPDSFTTTKSERNTIQENANFTKNGVKHFDYSTRTSASIPISLLTDMNSNINSATNPLDKKTAITNGLDNMASHIAKTVPDATDKHASKTNFIQNIIHQLTTSLVNIMLSPKVIMIFMVNYKIVYGPNADFSDAADFLKKNKTLINNITKRIKDIIIKKMLTFTLKEIATIVGETTIKIQTEKSKANLSQMLSLVGVPQSVLRLITGLL